MSLQNEIDKLKTLQESFNELSSKVLDTQAVLTELNHGKQEMVDALATKNVQSSTDKTLVEIASDVRSIMQSPITIDGGEMYAEQLFAGVGGSSKLWNLYEVLVDIKNNGLYQSYTGILLAEYNNISAEIALQGADAYLTSDGKYYTSSATHTWDKDEKFNRWVAYFLGENGNIGSYSIPSTELSPISIHIGRHVGDISCNANTSINEVVVTDGNKLGSLSLTNNTAWGSKVIIRNTDEHKSGYIINNNSNVTFYLDETQKISKSVIGGTCNNIKNIFILANEITSNVLDGTLNGVEFIQIDAESIIMDSSVLASSSFLGINSVPIKCTQIYCPNLKSVTCYNTKKSWEMSGLVWLNCPNWETYTINVSYQLFSQSSLQRITTNLKFFQHLNGNFPFVNGCVNLIDFEIGNFEINIGANLLSKWVPTNAMDETSTSLLSAEDLKNGFANNRQKLLFNIREHIAKKISNRAGLEPLTILFSQELRNVFDEETEQAFAAKNWNISPAKSV